MPEGHANRHEIRLYTRVEGNRVLVEVRDTGAGIKAEHLEHLFEPFFTTKPVGVGTGLGLFICKNIITSLGGTISVQSEVGKGTVFTVSLPISPDFAAQPATLPPAALVDERKARVLVVDDEPQIGRVIRAALRTHEVDSVISASDALAKLRAGERFDVIICDLMMPEMTGMDLFEELRGYGLGLERDLVFITGGAFTERAQEFLARVQNVRLEKPFDVGQVRRLVAERMR